MAHTSLDQVDDLEDFVEFLLQEKGIAPGASEYEATKKDILAEIEKIITKIVSDSVPKEKMVDYQNLASYGSDEEVMNFCKTNIPDFEKLIAGILLSFKQLYLGK